MPDLAALTDSTAHNVRVSVQGPEGFSEALVFLRPPSNSTRLKKIAYVTIYVTILASFLL
jgi:hypothetical protein